MASADGRGSLEAVFPLFQLTTLYYNDEFIQDMVEARPEITGMTDCVGETLLHLAVRGGYITDDERNETSEGRVVRHLVENGWEINARNMWLQTPLHLAVYQESQEMTNLLLKSPGIDVNIKDVNGYSPLHCFLDSHSEFLHKWEDIFQMFVNAGVDINSQTKYGHSVLHLMANKDDNSVFLPYILENLPTAKTDLSNILNENFLHVYFRSEIFEVISATLDKIDRSGLPELLNQTDVYGGTPAINMLEERNTDMEFLKDLRSLGARVDVTDNLGNTILHKFACSAMEDTFCGIMNYIIRNGVDKDAVNIFGQPAGALLYSESVFKVMVSNGADFNKEDVLRRTPLFHIFNQRPVPDLLSLIVDNTGVNVNHTDKYGTTLLHCAAFNDYEEQIKLLLEKGADVNILDHLGDRPLDTARRNFSHKCYQMLLNADNTELIYSRDSLYDVLAKFPESLPVSLLKGPDSVLQAMCLDTDTANFTKRLLSEYRISPSSEEQEVITEVRYLVGSICRKVTEFDSRFAVSLYPTGSSQEGTKVDRPDEFDFVLCLENLIQCCEIVKPSESVNSGYASLKFLPPALTAAYLPFCDEDGFFLPFPFLQYFYRYLKMAVLDASVWRSTRLHHRVENKIRIVTGKPVFTFVVYWIGSKFKHLKISIDLVPAVYKAGWWPSDVKLDTMTLVNDSVRKAGCLLIMQTPSNDFDMEWHTMRDSIHHTCRSNDDKDKKLERRQLRISAAPAEIALMKSLPETFREGYMLAKIMRSRQVAPEVTFDLMPSVMYSYKQQFDRSKPLPAKPSSVVKSYMLKNCTFYIAETEITRSSAPSDVSALEVTREIYKKLLHYGDERLLRPYFLPYSDVFDFESKATTRSSYKDFLYRIGREYCIKVILGILNCEFPSHCLADR